MFVYLWNMKNLIISLGKWILRIVLVCIVFIGFVFVWVYQVFALIVAKMAGPLTYHKACEKQERFWDELFSL